MFVKCDIVKKREMDVCACVCVHVSPAMALLWVIFEGAEYRYSGRGIFTSPF